MKNLKLLAGLVLLSSLFFSGCASGPELSKYSRTEIDRPYTLPKGVATWHIPVVYARVQDEHQSASVGPVPVPLLWESSLADDWNLIWFPLPLGVSHQFVMNDENRIGFTLLNNFSYSSFSGWRLRPSLSLAYRAFLSKQLAIEVVPAYSADIPFQSGENFRWSAGVSAGPLFQLSEFLSLKPRVSFDLTHGPLGQFSSNYDDYQFSDKTYSSMGLGASAVWSIGRQWDIRPDYHYSGIGSKDGLHVHVAVLDFVHFW